MQSLEVVSAQWGMVLIPAYHDRYSDSLGDGLSVNSRYNHTKVQEIIDTSKLDQRRKEQNVLSLLCASQIILRNFTVIKTTRSTNASHDPFQTNPNPSFCIPQTPSTKLYHPARAFFSAPSIISSTILFCIIIALSNITISSNQR